MDVVRRTAEVTAGRTAAELTTDLKEDDIRSETETKEGVRRRSHKSFEEVQAATTAVFYSTFAAELLSPHGDDLKAGNFRKVWYRLISGLDGSRIGLNNSVALVGMGDNIQYMNIICESAGLGEEKKLVLFLNGMDRALNVHKELRDTASQFRRDQKSY
ncbi:hypothetical protein B484DRAFT_406707 [Ochromonadaceae sp. CCMP2298]|nr:hypothetical protein B484DRAFT_406707 [Ochromonadaceae sp. CCMP2298]